MKKVYDRINVDLYIIAVAFGKNYINNVYARILISIFEFTPITKRH